MLKIRLSMGGVKKRPVYKIVIADSRFPRDGRFIEKVGFYNPLLPKDKKERINLEAERIKAAFERCVGVIQYLKAKQKEEKEIKKEGK